MQLIGHNWATDLLKRQQETGRIPQSLLLTGPPNVGKSTVARFFAQSLNCEGQDKPKPCTVCLPCKKFNSGNHPDVRVLDDDSRIKIEQIRELQHDLSLSPYEGRYRVALLCNFERATISAANALLKTLEEPPSQVLLILTATDPKSLLATITSRCQIIALRPVPANDILETLQTRWNIRAELAETLTQLAAGRPGWAIRALEDKGLLERREDYLQELLSILQMNRAERLSYANKLSRKPEMVKETLTLWLTIWRDMLLLCSGSQTKILNLDWQDRLQHIASQNGIAQIREVIIGLRAALINIERNVNTRLNLEVVLLNLPKQS